MLLSEPDVGETAVVRDSLLPKLNSEKEIDVTKLTS